MFLSKSIALKDKEVGETATLLSGTAENGSTSLLSSHQDTFIGESSDVATIELQHQTATPFFSRLLDPLYKGTKFFYSYLSQYILLPKIAI